MKFSVNTCIILSTIAIAYSIIKLFINKKGDWGDKPLSDHDIIYFLTTTTSTVGYGDIGPKSTRAKNFTIFLHLIILLEVISLISNTF